MKKKICPKEYKEIIHCIFEGMTTEKIADKLGYSKSTVSLKTKYIYAKYNVANKAEFIVTIFTNLIEDYKKKLKQSEKEIKILKKHLKDFCENIKTQT